MAVVGLAAIFTIFFQVLDLANGHGRLIEPPSRASAWRYGFNTPHNYNDHELFCGGFTRQWVKNEGKCGVCGDPWDSKLPRAHEYGGTYGQGVIVRKYNVGSIINIRVELTASHWGYFEFAICPDYKNTTQECLDRNILRLMKPQEDKDHHGSRYFPMEGNKVYEMKYKLPQMSCPHCVLQWRYIAGNNWGNCANGTGAVGCGPQEEFRSCADIQIGRGIVETTEAPTTAIPTTPYFTEHTTEHTALPTPTPSYNPLTSIIISFVSFLVVCLVFLMLYFHYYQVGKKFKVWLKNRTNKPTLQEKQPQTTIPMPPPRVKKLKRMEEDNMQEIDLSNESLA